MHVTKADSFNECFSGRFVCLKRLKQTKKIIAPKKHVIVSSKQCNMKVDDNPIKYWSKLLTFSNLFGSVSFENGYWIKSQQNTIGEKVKEYYFKFGTDYPTKIKEYNSKNKNIHAFTTYENRSINYRILFDNKSGNEKSETYYYKNGAIANITMINPNTKKVIKSTSYRPNGDAFNSFSSLD